MKNRKRYELTISVLENLKEAAKTIGELTGLINDLPGPYYKSFIPKEEYKERMRRYNKQKHEQEQREDERRERKNLRKLINQFQKEGIVKKNKKSLISLTIEGLKKLFLLKNKEILPSPHYANSSTKKLILITFDIPEKKRNKRDWLRGVLKELECVLLHESVWLSKFELPPKLIEDLKKHNILEYIKILSIHNEGNITEIFY